MKYLLWFGAAFYAFEAVIHAFGLPVLEHDVIFLPTHDGYIAIMALTYAALLVLISTDLKKYRQVFFLTMAGILLSMINAAWIASIGGYTKFFKAAGLDASLTTMGIAALIWFGLTLGLYVKTQHGTPIDARGK